MIAFLKGKLAGKTPQVAYIDVNGVGYAVFMSATALSKLPEVGGLVTVLTYLQVSDAGIALYGFLSEEEKATFERLIGVTGVGPKVALAALSTFSPRAEDSRRGQEECIAYHPRAEGLLRCELREPAFRTLRANDSRRQAERRSRGASLHGIHFAGGGIGIEGGSRGRNRGGAATICP